MTTSLRAVEAVYRYCRAHTDAEIIIGEGAGSGRTYDVFATLGYTEFAQREGLRLVDFNEAETVLLENPNALQLKQFHLPKIAQGAFIISIPVLKDHSFTKTTIAMKNMFGLAPGRHYGGSWNKSKLHVPSPDDSVVDVCTYKKPDLSVVDASVALTGGHLAGKKKHVGLILAGFDPRRRRRGRQPTARPRPRLGPLPHRRRRPPRHDEGHRDRHRLTTGVRVHEDEGSTRPGNTALLSGRRKKANQEIGNPGPPGSCHAEPVLPTPFHVTLRLLRIVAGASTRLSAPSCGWLAF